MPTLEQDLVEKRGKLDKLRKDFGDVLSEAKTDDGMDASKVKVVNDIGSNAKLAEWIRSTNTEMTVLGKEVDALVEGVKAAKGFEDDDPDGGARLGMKHRTEHAGDPFNPMVNGKSLGQLFAESDARKLKAQSGNTGPQSTIEVPDLKTLFTTAAGWAPQSIRTGRVVEFATRPIQVIDLMPLGRTQFPSIVYMEETTFTNNAAEASEGGTYAESALALTERNSPVSKIATFLPVTDEQLEDVSGIQSYVDNRLTFMLRQRLDSQLLVGDGSAPNLKGLLNVSGIQTQAAVTTGGDPDAAYKAMTKIRVTGRAIANGAIYHPTNWQDIKLLRTTDGIYIWGSPADMGPDRIWGLNVAQSDAITLNTALFGDFATHSELVMRKDIDVQVSNSHGTFFVEGKQAIRCDMRAAFVIYRPTAFCTVTGL